MQHKFIILGVPVFARGLASGDLAVWHPFNDTARSVIEPICRSRGYWQPKYKNWVITANWSQVVLVELAGCEDAL